MRGGQIHGELSDALVGAMAHFGSGEFEFYSWVQGWSDGSCGFGVPAGQSITDSTVAVAYSDTLDIAYVYVRGRYAYTVKTMGMSGESLDYFLRRIRNHNLPGRMECYQVGGVVEEEA